MKGRNEKVSLAWLGALALGAFGLLGSSRVQDSGGERLRTAPLAMDFVQAPGMGCSVVKELHFEMLPADAEPRVPPPRHARVCLAVYQPQSEPTPGVN